MAKKRKKKNKKKKASFGGSLADQLAGLDVKATDQDAEPPAEPEVTPEPEPARSLDDRELFELAMSKMDIDPERARGPRRHVSKKKKRRGGEQKKPKRGHSSPFAGALADQLAGLEIDAAPAESAPTPRPTRPQAPEREPVEAPVELPAEVEQALLTDEEVFARALEGMSPTDVFAGKYHGTVRNLPKQPAPGTSQPPAPGARPTSADAPAEDEEVAREQIAELREEALFARAVGGITPLDGQDKYYRSKPNPNKGLNEEPPGYSSEAPDGLITPTLPKSGEGLHHVAELTKSQKGVLQRCRLWSRQNDLPSLNLRGDSLEDALRNIELFMHKHWKEGARYVRVIHGRGLQSEDNQPVLKPSVLQWLEGPGFRYVRGYAPELTQDRDYGSLIVCMTRKGRD